LAIEPSDDEKFLYYVTDEPVYGSHDMVSYYGTGVKGLVGNTYAFGFELNPYSHVLERGPIISVAGSYDDGYLITYYKGEEVTQHRWVKNPGYYRMESTAFLKLIETNVHSRKRRSDFYQLCTTEFDFITSPYVAVPSVRPIVDPQFIEYDCKVETTIVTASQTKVSVIMLVRHELNEGVSEDIRLQSPFKDGLSDFVYNKKFTRFKSNFFRSKIVDLKGCCMDYGCRQLIIDNILGRYRGVYKPGKLKRYFVSPTLGQYTKAEVAGLWKNHSLAEVLCDSNVYMNQYIANYDDIFSEGFSAIDKKIIEDTFSDSGD